MKMLPSEDSNLLPANAGWATVVLPATWTGSTAGQTDPQPLQTRRTVDAPPDSEAEQLTLDPLVPHPREMLSSTFPGLGVFS